MKHEKDVDLFPSGSSQEGCGQGTHTNTEADNWKYSEINGDVTGEQRRVENYILLPVLEIKSDFNIERFSRQARKCKQK